MNGWNGTWRNDLGSEVELVVEDGVVSGRYRTQVGRPDVSEAFPVRGYVTGDLIAFVASFAPHGSLTSWTGRRSQADDGRVRIDALWHLVRGETDDGESLPAWASTLAGSARFLRRSNDT